MIKTLILVLVFLSVCSQGETSIRKITLPPIDLVTNWQYVSSSETFNKQIKNLVFVSRVKVNNPSAFPQQVSISMTSEQVSIGVCNNNPRGPAFGSGWRTVSPSCVTSNQAPPSIPSDTWTTVQPNDTVQIDLTVSCRLDRTNGLHSCGRPSPTGTEGTITDIGFWAVYEGVPTLSVKSNLNKGYIVATHTAFIWAGDISVPSPHVNIQYNSGRPF